MFIRCPKKILSAILFTASIAISQDASVPTEVKSAPAEQPWKASVGFTALFNSGNAVNQTFGGNSTVSHKSGKNQVTFNGNGAYGRAKSATTGETETNTNNWKTALRYDKFVSAPVSLFTLAHVGQDRPAGFDARYGGALGLSHTILKTSSDTFKYEGGYDFTHEDRVAALDADIHSGRVYFLYQHQVSEWAQFGQGVENLFNIKAGNDIRINALTSLTMKLTTKLAFQTSFGVRFDNQPVAGFKKTDTTTQAGLVLNFI